MKIFNTTFPVDLQKYHLLVEDACMSEQDIVAASISANKRNIETEEILLYQYDISRRKILKALSACYGCRWIEYDERLPIPPELLQELDPIRQQKNCWFPVIKDDKTIIIAAADPSDPVMQQEVSEVFPNSVFEFRVGLVTDILWFIQDYLNGPVEDIVGNERTGLAYWRNTMARWRTRLACYRTDYAKVRTHFNLLRGGLGLISIGRSLLHVHPVPFLIPVYWTMIGVGFLANLLGLNSYFRIKRSIIRPPNLQTLVEVTSDSLFFLEGYRFVEDKSNTSPRKLTMLARLQETLSNHHVDIEPSLDNKTRSALAHERTAYAAKRTIAGCYRTIYARARTGLSFIRTGFAFLGLGLGLMKYFGLSPLTILDSFIIISGLLIAIDGAVWYWPVRKEQHEAEKQTVQRKG